MSLSMANLVRVDVARKFRFALIETILLSDFRADTMHVEIIDTEKKKFGSVYFSRNSISLESLLKQLVS